MHTVSLAAGRLFGKGQEEHQEDELLHAGMKGCSLSDNLQTCWKIIEARNSHDSMHCMNIVYSPMQKKFTDVNLTQVKKEEHKKDKKLH